MEGQAPGDAERPARRSSIPRAECRGSVLEEHDLLRHRRLELHPLDGPAEQVHRDDGPSSLGHGGGDRTRVREEGVWIDVDEDGGRTAEPHRVRRGWERVGRDDHLVTRVDLECEERKMERGSS